VGGANPPLFRNGTSNETNYHPPSLRFQYRLLETVAGIKRQARYDRHLLTIGLNQIRRHQNRNR
jgi:hypothetical protein